MMSVVISTSPGREGNLADCLHALVQQKGADFEVVVSDDGSDAGHAVCAEFKTAFQSLHYVRRANDLCVSRSRNQGVTAAQGKWLVFLDGDVLLNPGALSAYARAFESYPDYVFLGAVGSPQGASSQSRLISGREVNFVDQRMYSVDHGHVQLNATFFSTPYRVLGAGNFGVTRTRFEAVGGFDERYRGWGYEDIQFAASLQLQGCGFAFLFDAWGEHQVHERLERFHRFNNAGKWARVVLRSPPAFPSLVLYRPDVLAAWWADLRQHYIPLATHLWPEEQFFLQYTQARYTPRAQHSLLLAAEKMT